MKKIFAIVVIMTMLLTGCASEPKTEHTIYMAYGRYYIETDKQGCVVTDDGNIWGYSQDIISDKPSYNDQPIIALFDDMGTSDNIYDDEIIGLVGA